MEKRFSGKLKIERGLNRVVNFGAPVPVVNDIPHAHNLSPTTIRGGAFDVGHLKKSIAGYCFRTIISIARPRAEPPQPKLQ